MHRMPTFSHQTIVKLTREVALVMGPNQIEKRKTQSRKRHPIWEIERLLLSWGLAENNDKRKMQNKLDRHEA